MKNIGGWSNYIIGVCPIKLKQKCFVLVTVFIHEKCMCEGVGEDSRHGAKHMIIHLEICIFLLNVCRCVNMALHVHLGVE